MKYVSGPWHLFVSMVMLGLLPGCSTTTNAGAVDVERKQILVPGSQVDAASAQAYEQTIHEAKAKGALDRDPAETARVQAVLKRLIPATAAFRTDAPGWAWESHVITSNELNAYCMPGGKIAFYSGIIEKLKLTDGEIAAIMGHEISHALREHGRERMTHELGKQVILMLAVASGALDPKYATLASAFSTVFFSLHFSREQEMEADTIGLELMARAGYDPREAESLWNKMASQGGPKPPQILSDHPADAARIKNIQNLLPKVLPLYEQANKR